MTIPVIDYQMIVNIVGAMMLVGFPVYLIFAIAIKLMNILIEFIVGKKRVNL